MSEPTKKYKFNFDIFKGEKKMNEEIFVQSKVDGCWICKVCGCAITPTAREVSEHLKDCILKKR